MIVNIAIINTAQYDKSPASAHPGAMSKGGKYVRVHLRAGTTSQPPKPQIKKLKVLNKVIYLSGMWVCGSGKRPGSLLMWVIL